MKKDDKRFNLEHQYQLYLKRVGANEDEMGETQCKEMRQAFMGACGQMLILLRDDVGELEEDEDAMYVLSDMLKQVSDYWIKLCNGKGEMN